MRGKRSIIITILTAVVALSLSLTVFAWVAVNNSIRSENQAMTITPVSDVQTIDCYALRYDGSLGAICYSIGDGEGQVLAVEMTEFDRIFRDRSVNTPLIYVVELANVPDTAGYYISVRVPCHRDYISVNGSTVNSYTSQDGVSYSIMNYISNIVSLKIGFSGQIQEPTPTTTLRVENNVNIFNTQKNAFKLVTESTYPDRVGQFATVTEDNETYTYSKDDYVQVRLTQSEYASSLFTIPGEPEPTGNHLMLYIQFDYDEDLMDNYISLLDDARDDDVAFEDDLGVIQILVGTN